MAEPTLSLTVAQIQAKIGSFLGYQRGAAFGDPTWTTQQQAVIDDCTQSALRRFYYPEALEGEATPYCWSFLQPTLTLDLPLNTNLIELPDDFGGFEGQVTILTTGTTAVPWIIEWRNEAYIRHLFSITPLMQGPPMFIAEVFPKGTTATAGQRFQVMVFPMADMDYTLQVNYYYNPDYITTALPYALGGAQHTETILESALSVAEERFDDSSTVHKMAFMSRLRASVGMDRKNKPQSIGYNRDLSDCRGWDRRDIHYWAPAATYNGQPFG